MTDDQYSGSETIETTASSTASTASPRSTTVGSEPATPQTNIYAADESVSEAVVETVASVSGVDPVELDPLYYTIDPDALDALFAPRPAAGDLPRDVRLSFSYVGLRVTVTAAGRIIVEDEDLDVD
ncbi:HalOD1 output domain-containing protein [Halomontanus rarus]|uniref:HalOD1 output domain-containing protein n=1 Tax=Halomontanus rarus TaxID=3034020 RepID=UPI001A97E80F